MTLEISSTVAQLIHNQMASGRYASEDALLVEALQSLEQSEEELHAIEAGLASIDRGEEGVGLEEAFARLREKHQIQG